MPRPLRLLGTLPCSMSSLVNFTPFTNGFIIPLCAIGNSLAVHNSTYFPAVAYGSARSTSPVHTTSPQFLCRFLLVPDILEVFSSSPFLLVRPCDVCLEVPSVHSHVLSHHAAIQTSCLQASGYPRQVKRIGNC